MDGVSTRRGHIFFCKNSWHPFFFGAITFALLAKTYLLFFNFVVLPLYFENKIGVYPYSVVLTVLNML
jgi:hypothetical protein